MDNNFSVTHSFYHIGDQVISCDFFYKIIRKAKKTRPLMVKKDGKIDIYKFHKIDIKKSNSDNNKKNAEISETETKKNNIANNSEENFKNNQFNDLNFENESNNSFKNINDYDENNDKNKFITSGNIMANSLINIFLLDIDGNVNFYNENGIKTLFNVNKVKEIDKITRERGLFSLNYSYIIKYSHPYLAISTDNGCYIFQLKYI